MRVQILSWSASRGGAARAANRLFNAIKKNEQKEVQIRMTVNDKESTSLGLISPESNLRYGWNLMRRYAGIKFQELQKTNNQIIHSSSLLPSKLNNDLNNNDAQLINLHWVQGEMISIKSIGKINKPLIFTLHDSWAFLGSEHHPNGYKDKRYIEGYWKNNKPPTNRGIDIDRICWQMKKKYWKRPFQIVCPSSWLAKCARNSYLMKDWPIKVIPNPLPLNIYKPIPRELARTIFNLDLNKDLILFGALNSSSNFNKGWDLLKPALKKLSNILPNLEAVVIGENEPMKQPNIGMKINYFGYLNDDQSLATLYSAVDVVIVPSRMENLPQAATEAQSCGIPVVAFNCSGFSDVVHHKKTGFLAKPFEIESLVDGINWILKDKKRFKKLSQNSRERAENMWDSAKIANQYKNLYREVLEKY